MLLAKARGDRVEVVAEGVNTKQTGKKLIKAEDFEASVKITSAGGMATLTGDARRFRLEHFAVGCVHIRNGGTSRRRLAA